MRLRMALVVDENGSLAARGAMRDILEILSCFAASAAILLGTSTSIAAQRQARSAQAVGPTELETQVLLDRANFSPGEIGYAASHGCVRLTNWDAARLAGLVTKGTAVVFEE